MQCQGKPIAINLPATGLARRLLPGRQGHSTLLWGVAASALVIATVTLLSMRLAEQRLRDDARSTLASLQQTINSAVDRARPLPIAVAHHPDVVAALLSRHTGLYDYGKGNGGSQAASLLPRVNDYLETVSDAADTSLLYIIDRNGVTLASSNWRAEDSLVGNQYLFRPYFQDALKGGEARYYAVGVTTGEAGYYFAQPVRHEAQVIGVAVVKTELESLQRQWENAADRNLLIDENGVVLISSEPAWRHRTTRPLTTDEQAAFAMQRKFPGHSLQPLQTTGRVLAEHVDIDGQGYLSEQAPLPLQGWTILQLLPHKRVWRAGVISALLSALLLGLSAVAYLYHRERRRKNQLSAAAEDAATLRALNLQLADEISEREKAEHNLRETQAELIQASKLAALGQMSTAIAHEVNQPLSAIRTFCASAKLLLERERHDEVADNLDRIKALTERLAALTSDLKIFARKSDTSKELICLQDSIHHACSLFTGDPDYRQASLLVDVPDDPIHVQGNAIRLEQVLSNLIRNALDAGKRKDHPAEIRISLCVEDNDAVLRVQDNGDGLDEEAMTRVFEPFFTTKELGAGVGLGLAISYGIVEELGGQIRVRNSEEGGALFSVRLPNRIPE